MDRRADQDPPQLAPRSAWFLEGQAGFEPAGATACESGELGSRDADYSIAWAKATDLFDDAPISRALARTCGTDASWRWGLIHAMVV
jgi:hypothetical protein